jgi:hypothetical protein
MTDFSQLISGGEYASKRPCVMNLLADFENTIGKNNEYRVTSGMYLTTQLATERSDKREKKKKLKSDDLDKKIFVLDSYLQNSDSSGLTLDSTSVTSTTFENDSIANEHEVENTPFRRKILTEKCSSNTNHKVWRSSYGNCNTISTRISRRPSISIQRQRSLRDVVIPESIAEDRDFTEFLMSTSHNEIPCDGYVWNNDSVSVSSTSYASTNWRSSVASKGSATKEEDDETDGRSSAKSIISKVSARILELPRDVEFDSCDSTNSSECGCDDLNSDFLNMEINGERTRHW